MTTFPTEAPLDQSSPEMASIERICDAILRRKYDLSTEVVVQFEIEQALRAAGISYKRERVIADRDRLDFLCEGGVAIEVKLRARPREIHRQLLRYCDANVVQAIILATARTIGLPSRLNGRPCVVLPLGRSSL